MDERILDKVYLVLKIVLKNIYKTSKNKRIRRHKMLIYGQIEQVKRSSKGMEKRAKAWLCTYNGIPPRSLSQPA